MIMETLYMHWNKTRFSYNYGQILLHFSSSESANVTEDSNPFGVWGKMCLDTLVSIVWVTSGNNEILNIFVRMQMLSLVPFIPNAVYIKYKAN